MDMREKTTRLIKNDSSKQKICEFYINAFTTYKGKMYNIIPYGILRLKALVTIRNQILTAYHMFLVSNFCNFKN